MTPDDTEFWQGVVRTLSPKLFATRVNGDAFDFGAQYGISVEWPDVVHAKRWKATCGDAPPGLSSELKAEAIRARAALATAGTTSVSTIATLPQLPEGTGDEACSLKT